MASNRLNYQRIYQKSRSAGGKLFGYFYDKVDIAE